MMKILQWNLENLFIFLDKYQDQPLKDINEDLWQSFSIARDPNKSLAKLYEMAELVEKQDPDICVFSEVGGRTSLENFNKLFLQNKFDVYMTDSNSSRGIDIGFLVKKNLPYKFKVKSNRKYEINVQNKKYKFSRDIPELRLYQQDQLKMVIMGVHFKSKISSQSDYQGMDTRAAEVLGLVAIYQRLKKKYQVPILVMGDFNGMVQKNDHEYEFKPIFEQTSLLDYLDYLKAEDLSRVTYVRTNPYQLNQLDYILIDQDLYALVQPESKVIRFTTFYDIELPLPISFQEKKKLPSDHYPQILILDFK